MTTKINKDTNSAETQEWLSALRDVLDFSGEERAEIVMQRLFQEAQHLGISLPIARNTPYCNTIPVAKQPKFPGDAGLEEKNRALIRWNALAMVLRATRKAPELGGHISTYASAAVLYEIGFNHFFNAPHEDHGGDLLYIQGHSSPGIYARAFLEGRLSEEQLEHFRQEVEANGIPSYPHPWLLSDFWQFATVSMGLGPLQAIYQARFLKYLGNRGLLETKQRKVWAFLGDGEMDEPESMGALGIAAKERLDNLIFVVNCNLQRLDGPVRGNSRIVQELEGTFRGAGWNVIKVLWGSRWDALFAKDTHNLLLRRMEECVDGDFQTYRARDGAYIRKHFFGASPELEALVADLSDEDIWHLNRGGHDIEKVYAAYHAAVNHSDRPTVILAKTIKGYGMGAAGEAQNITHQQKKMDLEQIKAFRDRFSIPVDDDEIADVPFHRPAEDSPELHYLHERRKALGGYLPARSVYDQSLPIPALGAFSSLLKDTDGREISTTMAFVRMLTLLMKDKQLGKRVVPIIPDECRTFGMEGMFRQFGIYSAVGQLYTPEDSGQLMFYKETTKGQVLEEGITEAGAFCSWLAAATAYSSSHYPMIPFYIYYSMFGFQRVGDLAWAAGDMRARGFLLGGTAGRTTLAGEGLQHQDGSSHVLFATVPNCITYDPTFSYELVVIMHHGLVRMYQNKEDVFYYITVMNENYVHPAMPEGVEEDIIKGMYLFQASDNPAQIQLLGSGTILLEVIRAAELLADDFDIAANIWSVTSFNELYREALALDREQRLHPTQSVKQPFVTQCLQGRAGPVVAATDYIHNYVNQIRAYVPQQYVVLGTDGFGRSDTRQKLRHYFEVDAKYIVLAALKALADEGTIPVKKVSQALKKYNIDPNKVNPTIG